MPGLNITTAASGGAANPLIAPDQYFVLGLTERGPVNTPIILRGMADYLTVFGDRPAFGFVYDSVKSFFDNGGDQAQVVRLVGPAATKGTVNIQDRAGTPLTTLKADAPNAGAWSSTISILVEDGTITNTVKVSILRNGTVVQSITNLVSPDDIVAKFAGSPYVTFTNMGSATASPNNNPKNGTVTLTAGNDDRTSLANSAYVAGLANFTQALGDGAVAIPGIGAAVHAGLATHAEANRRIALLSMPDGTDDATLATTASTVNSKAAGLFTPWLQVQDGSVIRTVGPEGYVAAARARASQQVGPWRAPAGLIAAASTVQGLTKYYERTAADALDAAKVNVIRNIQNSVRLYGWRSTSSDETNYGLLSVQDLLNRLVVESEKRLEKYVFETVDSKGALLSAINAEITGIVAPIKESGGLFPLFDNNGGVIDPGFVVDTSSNINSTVTLARNEVKARLSVRPAPTAALISFTITKVGLLAAAA